MAVMIPFASFLVGSILTLVLPVGLLVAIAVWYHLTVRRMPEAGRGLRPGAGTKVSPLAPDPEHAQPATGGFGNTPSTGGRGSEGEGPS